MRVIFGLLLMLVSGVILFFAVAVMGSSALNGSGDYMTPSTGVVVAIFAPPFLCGFHLTFLGENITPEARVWMGWVLVGVEAIAILLSLRVLVGEKNGVATGLVTAIIGSFLIFGLPILAGWMDARRAQREGPLGTPPPSARIEPPVRRD